MKMMHSINIPRPKLTPTQFQTPKFLEWPKRPKGRFVSQSVYVPHVCPTKLRIPDASTMLPKLAKQHYNNQQFILHHCVSDVVLEYL